MEIGLSLGSNLGDRASALKTATETISGFTKTGIVEASPVYETEPVDVSTEHEHLPFLNTVIIIETDIEPHDLHEELQEIEHEMGRTDTQEMNVPRPIDIDIIYAGDLQIGTEQLTIPHLRWQERRFVVQPLSDVRPDLILPGQSKMVSEILEELPLLPAVRRSAPTPACPP
jgi:2-amino-4-hydroxy-6-hydroxymethyldihydropteridine diphosphokinase